MLQDTLWDPDVFIVRHEFVAGTSFPSHLNADAGYRLMLHSWTSSPLLIHTSKVSQ